MPNHDPLLIATKDRVADQFIQDAFRDTERWANLPSKAVVVDTDLMVVANNVITVMTLPTAAPSPKTEYDPYKYVDRVNDRVLLEPGLWQVGFTVNSSVASRVELVVQEAGIFSHAVPAGTTTYVPFVGANYFSAFGQYYVNPLINRRPIWVQLEVLQKSGANANFTATIFTNYLGKP